MLESHNWKYSQQDHEFPSAPSGIRVTHLTSITTAMNEGDIPMGDYYPLQDMERGIRAQEIVQGKRSAGVNWS